MQLIPLGYKLIRILFFVKVLITEEAAKARRLAKYTSLERKIL